MSEPTLEELKARSAKALDFVAWLAIFVFFGAFSFLYKTNNDRYNDSVELTRSYVNQLKKVSRNEVEVHIVDRVGDCMYSHRRKLEVTAVNSFDLDKTKFETEMLKVKDTCLNSLQDDAELLNSRGGVSGGSDIKFAEKVKALMATQAL